MIMRNVTYTKWRDGGQYNKALAHSYCLFDDPALDPKKHVKPFLDFLQARAQQIRVAPGSFIPDVLVFAEDNLKILDLLVDVEITRGLRMFKTSGLHGWFRHFYRYAGLNLGYQEVVCTGTDTPNPEWLQQTLAVARALNHPLGTLLQCHHAHAGLISGSLVVRDPDTGLSLLNFLDQIIPHPSCQFLPEIFGCDEILLDKWYQENPCPTTLWCQGPFISLPLWQRVQDQMINGPHLTLIGNGHPKPFAHLVS